MFVEFYQLRLKQNWANVCLNFLNNPSCENKSFKGQIIAENAEIFRQKSKKSKTFSWKGQNKWRELKESENDKSSRSWNLKSNRKGQKDR